MALNGIEEMFKVTKENLDTEIARHRALAAPLRQERETLSREIDALRLKRAGINAKLLEAEKPLRFLKRLLAAKLHDLGQLMKAP